jgi:hypothetical protein
MTAYALKEMKQNLTFENEQILQFMKTNLIKDYDTGRLAIKLELS